MQTSQLYCNIILYDPDAELAHVPFVLTPVICATEKNLDQKNLANALFIWEGVGRGECGLFPPISEERNHVGTLRICDQFPPSLEEKDHVNTMFMCNLSPNPPSPLPTSSYTYAHLKQYTVLVHCVYETAFSRRPLSLLSYLV